jgi:hypothetical protein
MISAASFIEIFLGISFSPFSLVFLLLRMYQRAN